MQPSTLRLACVILLVILPATAGARRPTVDFDQLGPLLQPGDTAWVVDTSGRTVRGSVRYLSPSRLVLQVDGASRTFFQSDIERIRRRRNDPLANGARWGFAAGAGVGVLAGLKAYRRHPVDTHPLVVGYLGLVTGMAGAGIGAMVDAEHADERVVYSNGFATVTLGR